MSKAPSPHWPRRTNLGFSWTPDQGGAEADQVRIGVPSRFATNSSQVAIERRPRSRRYWHSRGGQVGVARHRRPRIWRIDHSYAGEATAAAPVFGPGHG